MDVDRDRVGHRARQANELPPARLSFRSGWVRLGRGRLKARNTQPEARCRPGRGVTPPSLSQIARCDSRSTLGIRARYSHNSGAGCVRITLPQLEPRWFGSATWYLLGTTARQCRGPGTQKAALRAAFGSSGGGIRTRDLRVMRSPEVRHLRPAVA